MSYSRWMHSNWYTYWDSGKSGEGIDNQYFTVELEGSFSYKELKNDLSACLKKVNGDDELRSYMNAFIIDCELEYLEGE